MLWLVLVNWWAPRLLLPPIHNYYFLVFSKWSVQILVCWSWMCLASSFSGYFLKRDNCLPCSPLFSTQLKNCCNTLSCEIRFRFCSGAAQALMRCLIDSKHLQWPAGLCVIKGLSVSRKCSICMCCPGNISITSRSVPAAQPAKLSLTGLFVRCCLELHVEWAQTHVGPWRKHEAHAAEWWQKLERDLNFYSCDSDFALSSRAILIFTVAVTLSWVWPQMLSKGQC